MTKEYFKYLAKLPKKLQIRIKKCIDRIEKLDLENLDIKKLKGAKTSYRCRVGKFRIIFEIKGDFVRLVGIDNRGNSY